MIVFGLCFVDQQHACLCRVGKSFPFCLYDILEMEVAL